MAVPYTFSTATGSLPLSQLDSNFATAITIGNTAVVLGDTITTINNLTLGNVAITSVSAAFPNGYLANSNVIVGTTTLTLGSTVTSINGLSLSNVTISSGNVTISNVTTTNVTATTANVTTANVGTLIVTGNETAFNNITASSANVSGTANVQVIAVTQNATVAGNLSVTGNVSGANGTFTSANISGTTNVSTLVIIGNTTVGGNVTVTGNVSMNVATITTANVSGTANISTLVITANQTSLGNITATGNVTAAKLIPTGTSVTGNGLYLPAANALGLSTNGTNAVYIDASQNVGIGTTSPTSLLHVSSTTVNPQIKIVDLSTAGNRGGSIQGSYGGNGLYLDSLGASGWVYIGSSTSGGQATNLRFDTSSSERMRIDSSGNVGIGTSSPSAHLEVSGTETGSGASLKLTNTTASTGKTWHLNSNNSGKLFFSIPSVVDAMIIDSSGNVGIGTSSPTAVLMLKAGTATASTAPLKLTSGTNLTTPEAGAVEYDGTVFYGTTDTNFKRGTLTITNYTSGTGTALGTNTEATNAVLLPSANDTITLSVGTYFLDVSYIVTRGATSVTSATARINIRGSGAAVGNFSGMSLSAPTAGGATANFSFDAVNITTDNVLTAASTTAAGVYTISLRGILKITTSGTIIPQYSLSANINAAGTVAKVLYFRLQQLDTQSAAAAGPAGTGWA